MPRIRKKTSKRTNLHQRARIKQKASETRKKRNKEAKKTTQWKTRHPKDPGIPANFPHKDLILAEIAEQRRQAADEKERRKEDRKAARVKALADGVEDSSIVGNIVRRDATPDVDEEVDDDEAPILLNPDYPNFQTILAKCDVVIQILDVRDPLPFRSSHVEELIRAEADKKLMFVLNKIDTCPRETVSAWATHLRTQYPTFIFRSASAFLPGDPVPQKKGKEKERMADAFGSSPILDCLGELARNKTSEDPLFVAVIGTTNAGKSSFINSLLREPICPIYKPSPSLSPRYSTTIAPQQTSLICADKAIHLIDTPGLSWHSPLLNDVDNFDRAEVARVQDILLRSRGRIDKLKDPTPPVNYILSRAKQQDLMLLYNLPAFEEGNSVAFLSGVARSNGLIKKGGDPDLNGAARVVLRDWSTGRFLRYTMPPTLNSAIPVGDSAIVRLYVKDETVMQSLKSRKEMRKSEGIVKLSVGVVNTRKIDLDAPWVLAPHLSANEDKDLGHVSEIDAVNEDDDGDEDEEDEDDDDEAEDEEDEVEDAREDKDSDQENDIDKDSELQKGKRKRPLKTKTSSTPLPRPAKKVSFARQSRPRQAALVTPKSALRNKTISGSVHKNIKSAAATNHNAKEMQNGEQAYNFTQFF